MAQEITVKGIRGPLGRGKVKFYAVTDDKDTEFTTFDPKISDVSPGSRLSIEVKVEGQYNNIVKWEVLAAPATPRQAAGPTKPPEEFLAERRSIEGQTAFNGMVRLIEQEIMLGKEVVPADIKKLVFDYARARLGAIPTQAKRPEPKPKAEQAPEAGAEAEPPKFENAGQFLAKCLEDYKLNRTQVLQYKEVAALFEAGDFNNAFRKLAEVTAGQK
jgi:hypothetical protein